jgi:hypothetical protein
MLFETLKVTIRGGGEDGMGLLMHNVRLANPNDLFTRKMKELRQAKKKAKAEADEIEAKIADVEWEGGLYANDKLGPYLPPMMIRAAIREAARMSKKGKDVERAVLMKKPAELVYDGPRDIDQLRGLSDFRHTAMVTVQKAKILRTRPHFPEWAAEVEILFLPSLVSKEEVRGWLEEAGMFIGIGDGRTLGYGRFTVDE